MEDLFRSIAIGLGVLMGTFQAGLAPELQLAVHKGTGQLIVSGRLEHAVSAPMEEALQAGVSLALTMKAEVVGQPATSATKTLSYRPLTKQWIVVGPGEAARTFVDKVEAQQSWSSWQEVSLGWPPTLPFVLSAEVTLVFVERPDWKADMVWKVPSVSWRKSVDRLTEIPN